jgi:dephospho-CoA kinase
MRVIGLTGGIASGKSTVARRLRDVHHLPVIDADQVARDVLAPSSDGLAALVAALGPGVLGPDGALDRPRLRAALARDPEVKRIVESITHPRIRARIMGALAQLAAGGAPIAVVEAALMVETGSYKAYDALWVVSARPEHQLTRVCARDGTDEDTARRLIAAQAPAADKERVATLVLRNDGSLAELERAVDAAVDAITAPSPPAPPGSGGA